MLVFLGPDALIFTVPVTDTVAEPLLSPITIALFAIVPVDGRVVPIAIFASDNWLIVDKGFGAVIEAVKEADVYDATVLTLVKADPPKVALTVITGPETLKT
jgi:hypothetical protein